MTSEGAVVDVHGESTGMAKFGSCLFPTAGSLMSCVAKKKRISSADNQHSIHCTESNQFCILNDVESAETRIKVTCPAQDPVRQSCVNCFRDATHNDCK